MKWPRLLDRLSTWLALNVVSAILVSLVTTMTITHFAGVWAKPSLGSAGLLDQAVGITKAVDATPAAERASLTERLSSPAFNTHWYARREQLPLPLRTAKRRPLSSPIWGRVARLLGRPRIAILGADPDDKDTLPASASSDYAIAIQLSDQSWVSFDTHDRSWGIGRTDKFLLTSLLVLFVTGSMTAIASRRLARPMQQLAKAAEDFGSSSRVASLRLDGPLEIREVAAAFNAMQDRIQQLLDSRTTMLVAISHDLRAPLTRMRMRGEFIEDAEQQQKLFRDVDDMRAMIESSLTFFRLDGQQEALVSLDLGELLHTVVDDFRDLGASVQWNLPTTRVVYHGRPIALKRAVTNLIDNAVKYGNSASVKLEQDRESVVIMIDDQGPGIPPALIPKLFEPFFRGEPSRNRATGGFGLGLASALQIIRSHHGELTIENLRPHGLRARITLKHRS
ncbi:ATP-binding protein [Dyella sp. A6]|uniref:ATP-binding protein n=1 Tax=Dyella aluminiiresistens TaxID=3069105 RepID=UPI002E789D16|nr:ATP-binding protein [Dyella sp. A6]